MNNVSGEVIYTYYKRKKEQRGTLSGDIFYRYGTPLIKDRYVSLEPDVLDNLAQRGCKTIRFILRPNLVKFVGQESVDVPLEDYKKHSWSVEMGIPDKRKQYIFDIVKYVKMKKNGEGQLSWF